MVVEHHLAEALLGVDGEAVVFRKATRDGVKSNEIGHGTGGIRAESVLSRLGGLEKHVGVAVAVKLTRTLTRETDVVTALEEGPGDIADGVRPVVLRGDDLLASDVPGASGRRSRGRRERIHSGRVNHSVAADVGVGVVLVGVIHDTIRAVNDLIRTTSGGASSRARHSRRRAGRGDVAGASTSVGVRIVLIRVVHGPRGSLDRDPMRHTRRARLPGVEGAGNLRADEGLSEALHDARVDGSGSLHR